MSDITSYQTTKDLEILGNKKIRRKSLKCLESKASAQLATRNENFDNCTKKMRKITEKKFHRKTILVNFENLSITFCPRFSDKTRFCL